MFNPLSFKNNGKSPVILNVSFDTWNEQIQGKAHSRMKINESENLLYQKKKKSKIKYVIKQGDSIMILSNMTEKPF